MPCTTIFPVNTVQVVSVLENNAITFHCPKPFFSRMKSIQVLNFIPWQRGKLLMEVVVKK